MTSDGFSTRQVVAVPEVFEPGTRSVFLSPAGAGTFLVSYFDPAHRPWLLRPDGTRLDLTISDQRSPARPGESIAVTNRQGDRVPMQVLAFDPVTGMGHRVPLPADDSLQQPEFLVGADLNYVARGRGDRFWWTHDGGATWTESHPAPIGKGYLSPVAPGSDGVRWAHQAAADPDLDVDQLSRLWRSVGGGPWEPIEVPGDQEIESVLDTGVAALVVREGQVMMLGVDGASATRNTPSRWYTIATDGTLASVGTQPPTGMAGVYSFGATGQIAVGAADDSTSVWISPDGTTWQGMRVR